jgi:YNFM family putative membrane transporter
VGAVLVYYTVAQSPPMMQMGLTRSPFAAWITHLRNPRLRAAFGIGFCILFAFIGTFTYVNFVLVRPPLMPFSILMRSFKPRVLINPGASATTCGKSNNIPRGFG